MPLEFPRVDRGAREARVVAVGGGKGGIGKTLLTANLGICFARSGRKVILVDADLGGSNLHTCLGIDFPAVSLGDFVQRRVERMQDVIVDTGVEGLSLISGAQDFLGSANIKYTQKMRLLRQVCRLDCDLVLMDLGSGTSFNVLDFFLVSDLGVVMMVPEPTSLENSYRFIKSAFYRLLRHREKNQALRRVIEEAMEIRNPREIRTPYDLIRVIAQMDPNRGAQYQRWLREFRPLLVINQARTADDRELGPSVRLACRKYFGIDLDYLGTIAYDDVVWKAVRRRAPLLESSSPESELARSLWSLAREVSQRLACAPERSRWEVSE